jgi:L-histidine N-alpha-methyltransferase
MLSPVDAFLLGADPVEDPEVLIAAYDDGAGTTAEFNKDILSVPNREPDAGFDPSAFDHLALRGADNEWIEMRLRARSALTAKIPSLDLALHRAAVPACGTGGNGRLRHAFMRPGHTSSTPPLLVHEIKEYMSFLRRRCQDRRGLSVPASVVSSALRAAPVPPRGGPR